MRWTESRIGEVRRRRGYLYMPKTINGETRVFEFAEWEEKRIATRRFDLWAPVRWVDSIKEASDGKA